MGSSTDELPRYQGQIYIGYEDGGRLAGYAKRVANVVLFDTRTGESINVMPKDMRYSAVIIPAAPFNQQLGTIFCVWRTGDTINFPISLQNYIYIFKTSSALSLFKTYKYFFLKTTNIPPYGSHPCSHRLLRSARPRFVQPPQHLGCQPKVLGMMNTNEIHSDKT